MKLLARASAVAIAASVCLASTVVQAQDARSVPTFS